MRILFWADGFWPRIGGTETQGLQFVKGMIERGHECLVVTQKYDLSLPDDEWFEKIRIIRLNFNQIIQKQDVAKIRPIKESLEKISAAFKPDLIYLNTLENGSAFAFLLFHKMFTIPKIGTIHTPYYEEKVHPLVGQICRQLDHLCTASQWGYDTMKKLLPPLKNPLRMIPYGLSLPKTAPTPLPLSPPTLLLLGRLSWEKGFDIGIQAFALLKKKGSEARLIIGGDGPERASLKQLVEELGLGSSVSFRGELLRSGESIFSLINEASLVVMPSLFEAFGLVALEAMQMGRPVIASQVGGLPEIIFHGERGLLVPLIDSAQTESIPLFREKERARKEKSHQNYVTGFFSAIETLLKEPQQIVEMGLRARKWALNTYLIEENLNQYEELFRQCV